jgi:hypothetical protein
MGCPTRMVSSVCDVVWDIHIGLFHKMGFGHQEDVCFRGVEKYFYLFYTLGQPICIPRLYVNYFTNLSTAVRTFLSVLICSACLDKIVSNLMKDLVYVLLCCFLVGVSILFLIASAHVILGRPYGFL